MTGGRVLIHWFYCSLFIFKGFKDMSPNQNYFKGHMDISLKVAIIKILKDFSSVVTYSTFFLLSASKDSRGMFQA